MSAKISRNKNVLIEILLIIAMCLLFQVAVFAQNVGINNPTPHLKSMLDIASYDKGLLVPRMSMADRNNMFPAADPTAKGMLVYQFDNDAGFYQYNGSAWEKLITDKSGWQLTGNSGTNPNLNFVGTTDTLPLVFRTNNTEKMRILPNGKVGLGTSTPGSTYSTNRFEIVDETGSNSDISIRVAGNTSFPAFFFHKQRGTLASPQVPVLNDILGNISARGWAGSYWKTGSAIVFSVDSTVTPGYMPGNIIFWTNSFVQDGEKMRLNHLGNLGLGTNNPEYKFDVRHDFGVGRFTSTNNGNGAVIELKNITGGTNMLGAINFNDAANGYPGQLNYHPINGMRFKTGGAEQMTLTTDGKLGLGTLTPFFSIDVEQQSAGTRLTSTNSPGGSVLALRNATAGQPILGQLLFGDITPHNYPASIAYHTANGMMFNTGNTMRMQITPSGNIGIGASNPGLKMVLMNSDLNPVMHIQNTLNAGWSGIQMDNYNNSGRTHIGFGNNTAAIYANMGYAGTNSGHPFILTTAGTERVRITPSGDVGIKTSAPGSELEVNGFTKLGSNAPAIKTLKLTGTTSSTQGTAIQVAHGLAGAKILSVQVVVEAISGSFMTPGYVYSSGYHFNVGYNGTHVWVYNVSANSANILSKPFKVFITYEE